MPATRTTTTTTAGRPPTTPAQASLYQRLRGHLAALKLHDAAEALPGVLDAAIAEGLTMTAALERLFAIEVTATEARRLAGRLRFASLPTPATLDDFDYDAAPAVDPALIAELATCRYLENATNVLLIGPAVFSVRACRQHVSAGQNVVAIDATRSCRCRLSGPSAPGEFAPEFKVLAVGLLQGCP